MDERDIQKLVNWLVASGIGVALFCPVFFLRQDFTLRGASDGLFLGAAILLFSPIFLILVRGGVFDVLSYGMYRLVESFKRSQIKRYETAYDYKESRMAIRERKKPYFLPYFIIGGSLLLLAILFLILFEANIKH